MLLFIQIKYIPFKEFPNAENIHLYHLKNFPMLKIATFILSYFYRNDALLHKQ